MTRSPLPIDAVLPELLEAISAHSSVVLRAPTGAGKTTRVPPALLDYGRASSGLILLLEPRRLAARAAARRMAVERSQALGDEIGYHVRFDRQAGPRTRVLAVTPGIVLRMLHDDPFLEHVAVVVFDEFHERGLDNDVVLGTVRLLQQTVRPELRCVVMSATLAVEAVSAYCGSCPIVTSEGRSYPVTVRYQPRAEGRPWPVAATAGVAQLLDETPGDLLVFLPGVSEIRQTGARLEMLARQYNLAVVPLHGELPAEVQDSALRPGPRRRVVLATNVAETSVTVEGITGVVDTGLARIPRLDPAVGLDRLQLLPITRSAADQRAGRAGRTQPGVCLRLWSELANRARPEQTEPEIHRVDLAGAVLHLLCLGETDLLRFPWLEPPRESALAQARLQLERLGAVDERGVTKLGRVLARLPLSPRLGRMVLEGHRLGYPERVALAAALLAERDPFPRDGRPRREHQTSSDLLDRVEALEEFERFGRAETAFGPLNRGAVRSLFQARTQLLRLSRNESRLFGTVSPHTCSADEALGRALLAAFPDRLARRREPGGRRGVLVGGRGVRLDWTSGVVESELFLCIDVDGRESEALVRCAAAVQREWLPAQSVKVTTALVFDQATERVSARRQTCFEDLVLDEVAVGLPDEEQTTQVLLEAAAKQLDRVLPPAESAATDYMTRVRCLGQWLPELQMPVFADDDLREMLTWLCPGRRSFAEIRAGDWLASLQHRLTHVQRQAVEREAPERLTVPSGSSLALRYELGRPPVLAVRIQELFGMLETPRVAAGRVPVLLHLLAPNHRPQQVTDDLASFWSTTYQLIRKELRARYPRHAWPEDPRTAVAERRPRRKGS